MTAKTTKFTHADSLQHFTQIRKRDGRLVQFDANKIRLAILKAGHATGQFNEKTSQELTAEVLTLVQENLKDKIPSVEEIQDLVETVLLNSAYKQTAKSYILYRDQHTQIRKIQQEADINLMDDYLDRLDWQVKENSNMDYSLQGLNNYISSNVSKVYWLHKIYPPAVRNAHETGAIHIHDLGIVSPYCVGWDLKDLLINGFKGVPGKVESGPANHFRVVLGQIANFFYTLQGEAAGAQAFSNFDTYLAPFIRYDNLSYNEVKQALQEFIFNINVPTRVGFQSPFTNITLDLQPPVTLANEPVIIGGKLQKETYSEFAHEMDMFNQAFLEIISEGDAKGRPFTFPIPTYNITKDFNWNNKHIELLWQITAKYGNGYFANFINSDMSPEDARSMCCRYRVDLRTLMLRGGGLFGANALTGSIGVVTINMAQLGYLASDEDDFIKRLDAVMELSQTSLEIKRKVLESFTENDLYPYSKFYLHSTKEHFGCYWHNHFSTIGLIGMNEACMNLFGLSIGTNQGTVFAVKVLDHMRQRLIEFQQQTGNLYNLEATPAEGATCRLAKLDKKTYPDIICANEDEVANGAAPFYTNSTHLPVNYTDDIFDILDHQDQLQSKYTGGTVLHVYIGEACPDPQSIKAFIRRVCEYYKLPYFTITPTFSICPEHGYITGEHQACPKCGAETEIYSRVVGYLRPVKQWNEGKQAEYNLRSKYKI